MDALLARRPGNDLHRPCSAVAPSPNLNLVHAAAPGGKQGCVPRKQPFGCERLVKVACGVEHHFNDALNAAVRLLESADVHAEVARNRGSDLFGVELFPFDLATLEHIGGQGLQDGFLAEIESEGFHVANQPPLAMAEIGETFSETLPVPVKPGPVRKLVDV